jgi:undecaprenyl-phosphate 4-deoxy-4-formamido-L-arabinose transferase
LISITIPVFNEQESLRQLRERLVAASSKLNRPWEVVLVNDGSAALLDEMAALDPAFNIPSGT